MVQLSYTNENDLGLPGMLADSGAADVASKVNPAVAIPFGCGACAGTDPDRDVKLPTSAAEAAACLGLALATQAIESSLTGDPQYPVKSSVNLLKKGRAVVRVTSDVVAGNPAFVRFANGVDDVEVVQKGSIGGIPDGVAQIATLTPAVDDTTNYSVSLFDHDGHLLANSQITSDGDAAAAEIVAALKAGLGTVPGVDFTGTDTLVITASVAGQGFTVESSSNLAIVATEANSQTAAEWKGSKFLTSAAAGGLAVLELNLPA